MTETEGLTDAGAPRPRRPLALRVAFWFVVAVVVLALLWFVVFPWMESLLPAEF